MTAPEAPDSGETQGLVTAVALTTDPLLHCFREDSPTNVCRSCGARPEAHEGCDC